jgi:hypothetical protein
MSARADIPSLQCCNDCERRFPRCGSYPHELNSKKKSDQQDEMPYKDWTASEPSNPGILFTIFPVD